MPFFSRNPNSRSNPGRSGVESQHLIQPQNTYKRFKISLSCLLRRCRRQDTTPQVPGIDIVAFGNQQAVPDGHEQHASVKVANDSPRVPGTLHHDSTSMQGEACGPFPDIADPATVPVSITRQLEGAQGFTISGNPILTNIGMNTGAHNVHSVHNVTTVNNYGGTHGLEKLEKFVSFAALYNSSAQDPDRRCHPGTRENVLMQLRQWTDNPNATDRIFWLFGPAGAGKSAIAQTVAHGYHQGEVVATFFFFRSDTGRNDGNRLFPTIAWQLAFSIPATKDFIIHALDKTPHLPMSNVETQFEQFVAQVFELTNTIASQMRHPAPVVIIDGLDECSDEQLQRRILVVIGNTVKNCRVPLRFLISSRPEALIEDALNQFQDVTLRIDLATLDDSNHDVEKYLVDKFSVIASKQGLEPSWPGQEIIQELVFKSSGNFIFSSAVMRYVSDEDYSAVSQLDIVRNLKPRGMMSPFALLDELYLEVLKQQRDQDFLKTFLAFFIGRSSVGDDENDAVFMNVSEKELHIKLRRMRSLLKFEPFIDVYHKSFLDFLEDSSRSGQYHVSKQGGLKRYLELFVDLVVRHVSMAIEQPNCHETCRSSPKVKSIVNNYPPTIVLPVEDWQEALKPLLHLQDKLLNTSKSQPCRVTQIMRDLQLQLVILQITSHHIAIDQVPGSSMHEAVTEKSPAQMTESKRDIPEKDLDSCLSVLLSDLQKTDSLLMVNTTIIDRMSSLLAFDYAETAARVRSVSDAQKLIDLIDMMTNNHSYLTQCGSDVAGKAAFLASEIFGRVPLLPTSFVNRPTPYSDRPRISGSFTLEFVSQSMFISRILDHDYIVPLLGICDEEADGLRFVRGNATEQYESVDEWLRGSSPKLVTRMRVMLEVAKTIRYIHSMDVALYSHDIRSERFFLDSNLRTKFLFFGLFAWWHSEASIYGHEEFGLLAHCTYESNISAFANLFHSVYLRGHNENPPNHVRSLVDDAKQLIERCRASDPEKRPTMENVVKEMETWNLT